MKTLLIFLKAPYSGHKMREESMCNMWSCVFPFHYVQNYHGNLGFLSWNIIEKSLKIFEACLWEPWMSNRRRYEGLWYLGCASLHSTIPFPHTSITPFSPCPHSQLLAEGPGVLAAEVGSHSSSQASPLPTTRPLWEQSLLVTTAARNIQDKGEPALKWRHNERDLKSPATRLFAESFVQAQIKGTSTFRITCLCKGDSPVTSEFPTQRASNAVNISFWRGHREIWDGNAFHITCPAWGESTIYRRIPITKE